MANNSWNSYFKSALAAGISISAFQAMSTPALAQDTVQSSETSNEDASNDDKTLETVVVTGTRMSLASALERRRNADTIADSIVAEDISDFPDKNIGEALGRITGVQLSRDFGEGAQVSIRGVEPDLNRVEINGVSALSSSGTSSRSGDFRELASELVRSVDVIKGSTADLTEGGVGGTVSVSLRKPLELTKPLLSATLSGQQNTSYDDVTPRFNIIAGDKWFDDRFGIIANVTIDDVRTRGDLARNTEWVVLDDFNGDGVDDYSPRIPRYGLWTRDDDRISSQLTGQFQVNDNIDVWAEVNYNERSQFLTDHNYVTSFTSASQLDDSMPTVVDSENNLIEFTLAERARIFETEQRAFQFEQQSTYFKGGLNYENDTIDAELLFSHGETENENLTNRVTYGLDSAINVKLDPSTGVPTLNFLNGVDQKDPNSYSYIRMDFRPLLEDQSEDMVKFDLDWTPDVPGFSKFEFGGQFRKYEADRWGYGGHFDADSGLYTPSNAITHRIFATEDPSAVGPRGAGPNGYKRGASVGPDGDWPAGTDQYTLESNMLLSDIQQIISDTFFYAPSSFPKYDGAVGAPTGWLAPDFNALANYTINGQPLFDMSHFNFDTMKSATVEDENGNPVTIAQIPNLVSEETAAVYAKANFEFDVSNNPVDGNFGVRVVETKTTASGLVTINERTEADDSTTDDPRASSDFIGQFDRAVERNYTDVLPSANARILLMDDQLSLRAGVARVMARPKITDLIPSGSCTYNADDLPQYLIDFGGYESSCSVGNPGLEPYRAWSYDLEGAFYPNDEAEIRLGFFYKKVDSYILDTRTLIRDVDFFGDGRLADVNVKTNGSGANTYGFEFSAQTPFTFLPSPWDGFGGQVNYTYSTADNVGLESQLDGSELPFPGQSEHTYNAQIYYDKGPINARLAYNYRTEWLVSAADRSGNPVFREAEGYLDAKASYDLTDNFNVFFEAKNLTDQEERTTAGSDARLSQLGWYGRRYYVGVKYTY